MRGNSGWALSRGHILFETVHTQQWYTEEKAYTFDNRISATCRCCDDGESKTILHILRCSSRKEVHIDNKLIFKQRMREIKAQNHLIHLFETGIDLALINGDTHSSEDWNQNPEVLMTEMTISDLLNDEAIPQQYKTAFQQQTKIGWEQLFMGKMASWWRQCWPDKTYWRANIAHTFMEWGRACWRHRNSILYGEYTEKYKMTRLRLKAEAKVWTEAPNIETLIPLQRDRWKRKLLKKAANSDIAFWLEC